MRGGQHFDNVCKSLADVGIKITEKMLMEQNGYGETILHIAMKRGGQHFDKLCKSLAEAGFTITEDMLIQKNAYEDTIFHIAMQQRGGQNFDNECKSLTDVGITITEDMLIQKNASGQTIFHIVIQHGDEAFDKLCKSLAEVGIIKITEKMLMEQNEYGDTIFHIAMQQRGGQSFDKLCKSLTDAGIKITEDMLIQKNAYEDTIFHIAMQRGGQYFNNVCKSLTDVGFTITEDMLIQKNGYGETILHIAMKRGGQYFNNVCKSLTDVGISITEEMLMLINEKGFTVLDYAALRGNLKCLTDTMVGSSNNEDALSVFIEKNKIDYCDAKENLIFFNPPNAKHLGQLGGKEYNLFNLELLKQYFNVFEISNISDARDIRKIDLQKNGYVNALLNIHGNSNAKYTMSLFDNCEATSDEVLNFVAAYSHNGAKLKILSKACFGANIHHSNVKLPDGSILMSLSDEDNTTSAIDYCHYKMQSFLSSVIETGPIKLEDFFKIYCLSQKVYQNVPKISIYNTENKVILSLDVFLEQNIEKINSLPKLVKDFLQNISLQDDDLLCLLPEVASPKQVSSFKAPIVSALGPNHMPFEDLLKQYYATPVDRFTDGQQLGKWLHPTGYKASFLMKHVLLNTQSITSDATSNAIAKHSLLLTLSADLFFTNLHYKTSVLDLVKGKWFCETMGGSKVVLETICDYISPVSELESLTVLGVVQDPVDDSV